MGSNEKTPMLRGETKENQTMGLKRQHFVIVPIVMVFCIPIIMIAYIVPEYIHDRLNDNNSNRSILHNYTYDACASNKSGPQYEHYKYVQDEIAKWQNYYTLARGIPNVLTCLIWTSYSDVIGRRMLMFVSTFGYSLKCVGMSLVIHFKAHFAFLLIGETIDGLTGSTGTFFAVLLAYIADITELGNRRTIGIVLVELMLGVTYTAVTLGTGYYIDYVGYFYTSVTGACCACFACSTTFLFLPETLRQRKSGSIKRLILGMSDSVKFYLKQDTRIKQIKYVLLIIAFLLYTTTILNRSSIETLYQLGKPFCWSSTKIGWFGSARQGCISLLGMGFIFIVKKVLADDTIAVISTALAVASYIVEGLAQTEAILYTVPALAFMSILPIPIIRSLLSHLTPEEKQGAVFASIGAVETICDILGALTSNLVYSATLSIMNGFVFLMLGALAASTGVILWIYRFVARRYPEKDHIALHKNLVN